MSVWTELKLKGAKESRNGLKRRITKQYKPHSLGHIGRGYFNLDGKFEVGGEKQEISHSNTPENTGHRISQIAH